MVNSGKQLIPCETKISAYTGETPMPPWPLRLTPFPHTSGCLTLYPCQWEIGFCSAKEGGAVSAVLRLVYLFAPCPLKPSSTPNANKREPFLNKNSLNIHRAIDESPRKMERKQENRKTKNLESVRQTQKNKKDTP